MSSTVTFRKGIGVTACGVAAIAGLLCPSLCVAADFVTAVVSTRPVAYYRLDSTSGKSQVGATQYKASGGVTSADPGIAGSHFVKLDGHDGYILTTQAGGVASTASIMAWVNLEDLPSEERHFFYVAGESESGNDLDIQFENDNVLRFYTASGGNLAYTPPATTLVHQWHMIVATVDTAARTRAIYWDGKLAASDKGGGSSNKRGTFSIGASTVFAGRFLKGGVEEVALWNRALGAREVATIYTAGKSVAPSAGSAPTGASAGNAASGASPFPTTAKVEVSDTAGKVNLKREEQIAYMFLTAIQQIEDDCQYKHKRACAWDEVLGRLKFDPRTDPNYTYTLAVGGTAWEAHANAKKTGFGGFYSFSISFPTTNVFYNASGIASVTSRQLMERSIEGDSFMR
ncbi:MAG TPA: LamG domain-containing protein [Bryobacteraceae bacterium]|nr:LamG domain-containing protein [Bryobacteraceae bacterium]